MWREQNYKSSSVIWEQFEKYSFVEFPFNIIGGASDILFLCIVFEIIFRFCSWLLWRNISLKMSSHLEKKYWKLAIQDYCNKILGSSTAGVWRRRETRDREN